jgi:hypothetical protein
MFGLIAILILVTIIFVGIIGIILYFALRKNKGQ